MTALRRPRLLFGLSSWPNDARVPAVLALAAGCVFVAARLVVIGHGDPSRFVYAGSDFTSPHAHLHVFSGSTTDATGYDGQFTYRFGLDPWDLSRRGHGVRLDVALRAQRIGVPIAAWLLSAGGNSALLPWALILVNLLALSLLALFGGLLAQACGRHAIWGLLVASPWCFLFTLARDLTELVEAAGVVAALVFLRRQNWLVSGLLLAASVLTRETAAVTVAAVAGHRITQILRRRGKPGLPDLTWLLPTLCFAGWQWVCKSQLGQFPITSDTSNNLDLPFVGVAAALRDWFDGSGSMAVRGVQFLVLLYLMISAGRSLRQGSVATSVERTAWVLLVVLAVCLSGFVWQGWAEFRIVSDLQVYAFILLIASKRKLRAPAGANAAIWLTTAAHRVVSL